MVNPELGKLEHLKLKFSTMENQERLSRVENSFLILGLDRFFR